MGSTISWVVNIAISVIGILYSTDQTTRIFIIMGVFFIGTPALILLLWDRVSNTVAVVLPISIMTLVTFVLFLYLV